MVLTFGRVERWGVVTIFFWRYVYRWFVVAFLVFSGVGACLLVGASGFSYLCVCGFVLCGW